jgi:superfamily II DNA or RNA helicase
MKFKTAEEPGVIIFTNKTGSHAYDIPQANIVIFAELPWYYYVKDQAFHRVLRPGQNKDVIVYTLLNNGMVDESINITVENRKITSANMTDRSNYSHLESLTYLEIAKDVISSFNKKTSIDSHDIITKLKQVNDSEEAITVKI